MRRMMRYGWVGGVAFLAGMLLCASVSAQTWNPCLGDEPWSDDYGIQDGGVLTNGIVNMLVGVLGTVNWGNDGDDSTPETGGGINFMEEGCFDPTLSYEGSGRFAFGYENGSPVSPLDDGCAVTMGYPFPGGTFCYATIRVIDSGGSSSDKVFGESANWLISPYLGASGNYCTAWWDFGGPNVWVNLRIDVLGDTWRFQWSFYNFETENVQVGMRFGQWTAFRQNDGSNNGARRGFIDDTLYLMIPGERPLTTDYLADRAVLGTSKMPPYFDIYWSQQAPYPSFRQWLKPDSQHPDTTLVDRLEHAEWERQMFPLWNGFLIPDKPVVAPAYAVFYNPISVPPSATTETPGRVIVQYMSSANAASDIAQPVAVTTETVRAVQFDSSGLNGYSPNPFRIYATVSNGYSVINREVDLTDVTVSLALPPGLRIADGDVLQKTIQRIAPGANATVSWEVEATGEVVGDVTYRVLVSPPPANAKTVTNTVILAAVNKLKVTDGYQLVTLPFEFDDTRYDTIFGIGGLRTIGLDEDTGRYMPIENNTRGRGFWFDPGENTTFTLAGARPPGNVTSDFKINLKPGWQMIGNPWLYPVPFGQLVFVGAENPTQARTLSEAVGLGWIRGVLYHYDKALREYKFTENLSTPVQPSRGYWVKVTSREQLQVSWPPVFAPGVGGSPRSEGDNWTPRPGHFRMQVAARSKGGVDTQNFFGISEKGLVGLDDFDVPEPPMPPEAALRVTIEHPDWGEQAGPYAQDIHSSADANQSWEFTVTSFQEGEVTLTWPNLSQVPRQYGFRLIDLQTGVSRNLRSVSSYTFQMGEGQRKFKLEMFPSSASRVMITGMNVNQSRGGITVQYALSNDASTTVRVLSASGQVVQTIALNAQEARGVNTHVWNTRNTEGVSMPPGTYIIEVAAIAEDGQVARVVRPHVLTR